jgi:septal ring factor EnvC (AmiA/AmiB activator)
MTRSPYKKTFIAARSFAALGLVGAATVAAAQDASTRYAQILTEADISARYNVTIESQLRSQEAEMASLQQQIDSLDATAAAVQPMLQTMFEQLEAFVAADVPFLEDERKARIARLRDLMNQVDASTSEKFRRLIEAYTIEMEYGRTMDSYKAALSDGRDAEFVRLGRVSLMYRTVDGGESAYWDNDSKMWVKDAAHARQIEEALHIAKQETAPDLITVPVPASKGGRS